MNNEVNNEHTDMNYNSVCSRIIIIHCYCIIMRIIEIRLHYIIILETSNNKIYIECENDNYGKNQGTSIIYIFKCTIIRIKPKM